MNLLRISVIGLGLATLTVSACSSSSNNTGPVVVPTSTSTSINTSISTGVDAGTGTAVDTGTSLGTGTTTTPDAGVDASIVPADGGGGVDAGGNGPSYTKDGHLAIINAPTTGGLDVTGATPPAYTTCK